MKKYLSILAFSCLTLCSCDNFLDLTPQSVLTPENAYEKPEDWQQTLYAAYGTAPGSLCREIYHYPY